MLNGARLRLVVLSLVAVTVVGVSATTLLLSNGSSPANPSISQAQPPGGLGDVRHWQVSIKGSSPSGAGQDLRGDLWLTLDGSKAKAEMRDVDGRLISLEVEDGLRLDRLVDLAGGPIFTSETANIDGGFLLTMTGAKQRMEQGRLVRVGSQTIGGVIAMVTEIDVTSGDEGPEWVKTRELVHPDTGFLLARIYLGRDVNGNLVETGRNEYTYVDKGLLESKALPSDFFTVKAPAGAEVYRSGRITLAEAASFAAFDLYTIKALPAEFGLAAILDYQSSSLAGPGSVHQVRFIYQSRDNPELIIHVLNMAAGSLAGVPYCDPPSNEVPPPAVAGNVVLEGAFRCPAVGHVVDTPLGQGLLRGDRHETLELQVGSTFISVSGPPESVMELAGSLASAKEVAAIAPPLP